MFGVCWVWAQEAAEHGLDMAGLGILQGCEAQEAHRGKVSDRRGRENTACLWRRACCAALACAQSAAPRRSEGWPRRPGMWDPRGLQPGEGSRQVYCCVLVGAGGKERGAAAAGGRWATVVTAGSFAKPPQPPRLHSAAGLPGMFLGLLGEPLLTSSGRSVSSFWGGGREVEEGSGDAAGAGPSCCCFSPGSICGAARPTVPCGGQIARLGRQSGGAGGGARRKGGVELSGAGMQASATLASPVCWPTGMVLRHQARAGRLAPLAALLLVPRVPLAGSWVVCACGLCAAQVMLNRRCWGRAFGGMGESASGLPLAFDPLLAFLLLLHRLPSPSPSLLPFTSRPPAVIAASVFPGSCAMETIVEFKAGQLLLTEGVLKPDTRKGLVRVSQVRPACRRRR